MEAGLKNLGKINVLKLMKLLKQTVHAVVERSRHNENRVNAVSSSAVGATSKEDSRNTVKMELK